MKDIIFEELKQNMEKGLQALESSSTSPYGRASLSLLEDQSGLLGTRRRLTMWPAFFVPESRLILISPGTRAL